MKKTISILLALVMALSVFSVMALAEETPDITYEVLSEEEKTCKVTGAKAGIVDLVIPAEIDGYKVVYIDNRAFWSNKEIETVQIPDSVERIGQLVFSKTALYKNDANWENDVLYIGKFVIVAKSTLEGEYAIKAGTTVMADAAFRSCKKLTKITIPEGMKAISLLAFRDCEALAEVVFPSTLKSIDSYAFLHCTTLKAVILPEGLEKIGSYSFNDSGLTDVTIPASVKEIDKYAFCHCADLTAINVAEANENYSSASGILYNKDKTTVVYVPYKVDYSTFELPETVTTIGKGAFEGATFEEFEIPETVTTIENAAFEGCANLKKVKIPASVTEIADNAFGLCHDQFVIEAPEGSYAYTYGVEKGYILNGILGDVTGDGKVTAIDARQILQYAASNADFSPEQIKLADLNGDGTVTAFDPRLALQVAANS